MQAPRVKLILSTVYMCRSNHPHLPSLSLSSKPTPCDPLFRHPQSILDRAPRRLSRHSVQLVPVATRKLNSARPKHRPGDPTSRPPGRPRTLGRMQSVRSWRQRYRSAPLQRNRVDRTDGRKRSDAWVHLLELSGDISTSRPLTERRESEFVATSRQRTTANPEITSRQRRQGLM